MITSSDAEPLLRVVGVSKSFGGLKALQDVSFEVFPGSILGIIGPNGAGKTTLFDVLNGFTPPDTGGRGVRCHRCDGSSPQQDCGRRYRPHLPDRPRLPADECRRKRANGAHGAEPGLRTKRSGARRTLSRSLGCRHARTSEASLLTNREVRLLELARALAGKPRLLLLDETLAGLSRDDVADVISVVRRLPSIGVTVIIIEHTMHAMLQTADQLLVLDYGKVLMIGKPGDVVKDPVVVEAYLGQKWAARYAAN